MQSHAQKKSRHFTFSNKRSVDARMKPSSRHTMKLPSRSSFHKSLRTLAAPLSAGAVLILLIVLAGVWKIQSTKNTVMLTQYVGAHSPLRITFPEAMEKKSTETEIRWPSEISGNAKWESSDTLTIQPSQALTLGNTYSFRVSPAAKRADGTPIAEPITFTFIVSGAPALTASIPVPSSEDVPTDAHVTLVFDRPMIPLAEIDSAARMPEGWNASITPPIKGRWRWLSTYAVEWAPEEPLALATTYNVSVPAGISAMGGEKTENDFSYTFTTKRPHVVSAMPDDYNDTSVKGNMVINFSQAIDLASVSEKIKVKAVKKGTDRCYSHLYTGGTPPADCTIQTGTGSIEGTVIPVKVSYGTHMVKNTEKTNDRQVILDPTGDLPLDTIFVVEVPTGVKGKQGSLGTREVFSQTFHTAGVFELREVRQEYGGLIFQFTNMISSGSIVNGVTFDPPVPDFAKAVSQAWQSWDGTYTVYPALKPSTTYKITAKGSMKDEFGQTLGKDRVFTITTPQLTPTLTVTSKGTFGFFERAKPAVFPLQAVNVSSITATMAPLNVEEVLKLRESQLQDYAFVPNFSSTEGAQTITIPVKTKQNEQFRKEFSLQDFGEGTSLQSGVYGVTFTTPEEKDGLNRPAVHSHVIVLTNMALTLKYSADKLLVWAVDMTTGEPVSAADIEVRSLDGKSVAKGKTNAQGIAEVAVLLTALTSPYNQGIPEFYVTARKGTDFAFVGSNWNEGLKAWDFSMPYGTVNTFEARKQLLGYVYTDRPLYKANDTVHIKGILRIRDKYDGTLASPKAPVKAMLNITDPSGNTIESKQLTVSQYGTVTADFTLGATPTLGYYGYTITLTPDAGVDEWSGLSGYFSVQSYRKADFRLEMTPTKEDIFDGETAEFDVEASYFFGSPLGNANIKWRAQLTDYFFNKYTDSYYSFGTMTGWCWGECERVTEPLTEGEITLDAQGKGKIRVPASLVSKKTSQILTVEADVSDESNVAVSAQGFVAVHKSRVYPGVRTKEYIIEPESDATVEIITLNSDGTAKANQAVTVELFSRKWNTVQKEGIDGGFYNENEPEDTRISSSNATTDSSGKGMTKVQIPSGGEFIVRVTARDEQGRSAIAETSIYAWSDAFVYWPQGSTERIDIAADKPEYKPGEKATILVKSPFQGKGVKALVTVERERVRKTQVIDITSAAQPIEVEITEDMIPNAFVSVVITKPRQGESFDKENIDTGVPAFRIGYTQLLVNSAAKKINIEILPSAKRTKPGDKLSITIRTKDAAGKPIAAEVSLSAVDMALLALSGFSVPDLKDYFYGNRSLGVETAAMLKYLVERYKPGSKGGGGGPDSDDETRGSFLDTAFWKANIATNASGEATVNFALPDNLTTWKLLAIATSAGNTFGAAESEVLTTKDVLVRPVLPRFAVQGDKIQAAAIVQNDTEKKDTFQVSAKAKGALLDGSDHTTITLNPGERRSVPFPMTVQNDAKEMIVTFRAESSSNSDAIENTLPVVVGSLPVTVATSGEVTDKTVERIQVPRRADVLSADATLTLSSSMGAWFQGSLEFLTTYPYGCAEQITSGFLGNLVTSTIPGFEDSAKMNRASLEQQISEVLPTVYRYQREDGGFGYFEGSFRSDPALTAYILFALQEAKRERFAVDNRVIDRARTYLQETLRRTGGEYPLDLALRVHILWVLAEGGAPDAQALTEAAKKRDTLPIFARAQLAMGLNSAGGSSKTLAKTILGEILGNAKVDPRGMHFEEDQPERWMTLFQSEARTTALVLQAMARIEPEHALLPNVVRTLMSLRIGTHWDTTQSSLHSLLAFRDVLRARNEGQNPSTGVITFNGASLGEALFPAGKTLTMQEFAIPESKLKFGAENLIEIAKQGAGRLYYELAFTYRLKDPSEPKREEGMSVQRTIRTLQGLDEPLKVGNTYVMTVTVTSPQMRHAVAVTAPLPAGLELVNSDFLTSPRLLQGNSNLGEDEIETSDEDPSTRSYWDSYWSPPVFSHIEQRADELFLFAEDLPAGVYRYAVLVRAITPGTYFERPAKAWMMYMPEVFGQTPSRKVIITE